MFCLGHKIDKSTKKCKRLMAEQKQSEDKVLEELGNKFYQKLFHDEFKQKCHEIKADCSNSHLSSLLQLLVREQNQNEEILIESLKQLKKSHLLLRSQGQLSDETKQDFDVSILVFALTFQTKDFLITDYVKNYLNNIPLSSFRC